MTSVQNTPSLNSSADDLSPLTSQIDDAASIDASIANLSSSIFMYTPKVPVIGLVSTSTITLRDPSLILLFSWTGAQRKHITKYISGYIAMFPSTPIIVITTCINDLTYRTSSRKRRSLFPAITTIANSTTLNANLLVHVFSEGGSSTAVHFAKAFRAHTRRRLPVAGLVCDSCPGTLHFNNLAHTARQTVPNNPTAQVLASLAAYTVIASYWATFLLIGDREDVDDRKDLNAKTKVALNDPSLWNRTAPRAYLFSKADKLIDWKTVLNHARDAETRGTPVFVELFDKSAHCAHIRAVEDAERYWRAVQRVWDTSINEPGDGVWSSMDGKKDVVDVTVQELGLQGRRPVKNRCTCLDCGR